MNWLSFSKHFFAYICLVLKYVLQIQNLASRSLSFYSSHKLFTNTNANSNHINIESYLVLKCQKEANYSKRFF